MNPYSKQFEEVARKQGWSRFPLNGCILLQKIILDVTGNENAIIPDKLLSKYSETLGVPLTEIQSILNHIISELNERVNE